MKKLSWFAPLTAFAAPLLAAAQTAPRNVPGGINLKVIEPYSTGIINLINGKLVPVLMAIALIVFLWGLYKYFIYHGENELEKADGRKYAMWGLIGFVIILSFWGLVNIIGATLGLTFGGSAPEFPRL